MTSRRPELHLEDLGAGRWTWRYVEPGVQLDSNETYDSREAAAATARRAYPDVRFAGEGGEGSEDGNGDRKEAGPE